MNETLKTQLRQAFGRFGDLDPRPARTLRVCSKCGGQGWVEIPWRNRTGVYPNVRDTKPCPDCGGTGWED